MEVLDAVSTVATRASSIAGSVLGEALPPSALVGEVLSEEGEGVEKSGESSVPILDPSPTTIAAFAFAEPTGAATDSDDEQVRPDSRLCFDFSLPVDTSQLEKVVLSGRKEEENEKNEKMDAAAASILRPSSGIFQLVHEEESAKDDSGDEGDDDDAEDEEDEDGDEEEDEEEDEVDQALDFSWTKVAPRQVEASNLVEEDELGKHSFTTPTVVSVEVLQEKDDDQGQFTFGAPHNESTISEGEIEPEIINADAAVEVVDEKAEGGLAESTEDEDDDASEKEAAAELPKRTRTSSRRASTSPLGRSTSKLRSTSSPLTPK